MGIIVDISQREQERAEFNNRLEQMVKEKILTPADEYLLKSIKNPKDAFGLLAVKEKQWRKRVAEEQKLQQANQEKLLAMQGENLQKAQAAKAEGDVKKVYAKGDVDSKLVQLQHELGLTDKQMEGMIRQTLQDQRMKGGIDKSIQTMQTKHELANQEAIA
jgi:hypothetical protein